TEGEHEKNPPHFRMTQQEKPDFSPWQEPEGKGMHGFNSHLRDRKELAKGIAVYYGMMSLMDKYIGRIVDNLDALGLAENTLVVFTTDHGHFFGQHGLVAKGAFHYEDMIKLPFIVRHPGRVPAGRQSAALQTLVDLAPSFLSAAGIETPREMTGVDQTPVWYGEQEEARDHIIVENRHEPDTIHVKTYVDERYKLTVYYNQDYGELFDLQEDPQEINNLWSKPECAELKAELMRKLLFAEMGKEPLWMPRVAGA
ncbi:MAG: sulfatase-like hydrolase/transferase, partial [Armatimonadota bacterium]